MQNKKGNKEKSYQEENIKQIRLILKKFYNLENNLVSI